MVTKINPHTSKLSLDNGLDLLTGKDLKHLMGVIPQDIRESGLPRYQFSKSKIGMHDINKTESYLRQFIPPLTIDFQRTRNSTDEDGDTKAQRFYKVGEIHIVAACLFSRSLNWQFVFGNHENLAIHPKYSDRYTNALTIAPEKWTSNFLDLV